MNNRERLHAIMNFEKPDRMPVVHFGYTPEVVRKWVEEGHLTSDILQYNDYAPELEDIIGEKLGFDFGWNPAQLVSCDLFPHFTPQLVEHLDNGFDKYLNTDGVYILQKKGAGSIPAEVDHLLKDRESWEKEYLPKLTYSQDRFSQKSYDYLKREEAKGNPVGLHCGSLCGRVRDLLGITGLSYMTVDDEDLLAEIFDTIGNLCVKSVEQALQSDIHFDYAHFWEDVCYKNGPLISPAMFEEYTLPHYQKITELVRQHGIDIISVDCDGLIDSLVPVWLKGGLNTMFPIEVGTWNASIEPWREQYGRRIRGIGGMRKSIFALDYEAIDKEVERLGRLAALSGYIPCPDHRIPLDARWENIQYYCDKIRNLSVSVAE